MNESQPQKLNLQQMVDEYGKRKRLAAQFYADYKDMQVQLAEMSQILRNALNETGMRSVKTSKYGASITTRKDFTITNEHAALEWLKEQPNVEHDFYIGLKVTPFKTLVTQLFKETGEIPAGTEVETKESLTIRSNKDANNTSKT